MNIVIGLIPAVMWGTMPIAVNKLGGKPINQLLGTVYGALILSLIILFVDKPIITGQIFFWNFIAGLCWAFGQITQYSAYNDIGVSMTMPVTTGEQLTLVSTIGVLFFGSWNTNLAKILGFVAVVLDIIGAVMTTQQSKEHHTLKNRKTFHSGITKTMVGTLGFVAYNSLPKIPNASGWRMFFPQVLGMLAFGVVASLVITRYRITRPLFNRTTLKNVITGLMFGCACCGFLFSIRINGLSTGFTLSQLCVAIATISGIVILHEHKSRKELNLTIFGLILILIGTFIVGFI